MSEIINIELEKPIEKIGYSSHGYTCPLREIVELETDRENEPFIDWSDKTIEQYGDCEAIWVATTHHAAFRYNISASEWDLPDDYIEKTYPDYKNDLYEMDLTTKNVYKITDTDDGDDGYLIIWLKKIIK